MYKRRTKSGNLGIVRTTVNKTPDPAVHITENVEPKAGETSQAKRVRRVSNAQGDDSDNEVLTDSEAEPMPKRSRRFTSVSNATSVMRELSNTSVNPTSPRISSKVLKTLSSSSMHNLKKDSTVTSDSDGSEVLFKQPSQSRNKITQNVKEKTLKEVESLFETRNANSRSNGSSSQRFKENLVLSSQSKSSLPFRKESSDLPVKRKTNLGNFNKTLYLEELFENAGLVVSHGSTPNILKVDQAIFVRDVIKNLSLNEQERKRNVENLMKDLEHYCNNVICLKYSVTSTETDSECEVARGSAQDSLMRLLLHVDCLQAPITELLMDKLAKFVMDGVSEDDDTPVLSWTRMILHCYRFLDRMLIGSTVNDRLLDILLATSDVNIQQEIVLALPDIIGDAEHHHTAIELSKLVRKSSPALRACALEALTNLSLQPEVRAEVQPLLMRTVKRAQPEFLPTILKFLFTDCDMALIDEMITYLRAELDLTNSNRDNGGSEGDAASAQVLVFSTLRDSLLASRTLPNTWLKNISAVKTQADHRPIDIIILLVLLSTSNEPARHKAIEALFRNKIRAGLFTETLIHETIKDYIAVIKEYFQVTIKLAGALLKSTEPAVVEFSTKMYISVFGHTEGLWCQWLVTELQVCVGAGDSCTARAALNVLQHLTDNYHAKIKPLGVVLMLLLNKLNDLAPSEVCQLMDVLCHVAYSDDDDGSGGSSSDSLLQDEINILIQKQLASSQISTLRSGVIGCVMSIKHIATVPTESTEPGDGVVTEKAKKASHLLELLLSSTRGSVETHGLALDQLAHLLIAGTMILDASFINILSGLMRDKLQDAFLVSCSEFSPKDEVLKSKLQFCLDDDSEGAIALNISELTAAEASALQPKPSVAVSCLYPLLRLLRGLEMADLSEIDALLGCAIAMPAPLAYVEFGQLSFFQQHVALDCLFHCANWFTEIINCFAYLAKQNDADKVLMRLRAIVHIRGLLTRCLPLAMEYTPPICHFQALPKPKATATGEKTAKKGKKKKGKKKSKKKTPSEESVLTGNDNSSQPDEEEEEEESPEEKMADLTKYKHYFRELDIDVWLILTLDLTLSPRPEKNGQFSAELGASELLFLLDDYVAKLSRSLTASTKRMSHLKTANQSTGFENLEQFSPLHIAKNTIKLLPHLCSFLEKTVEYTQNLVKINDGILDASGMFLEGSAEIKKCQAKLFRIIAILFSWVGFQNPAHNNYLMASLQNLASRTVSDGGLSRKNKRHLVRECINYLGQCREHVLDLEAAGALVDAVTAVARHAQDDAVQNADIATLCQELLGRRWYDMKGNREKGAALNSQAAELLSRHLRLSRDQLTAVMAATACLAEEHAQLSEGKDATLATYPAFSKLNLHLLVGGLLKGLEGAVRQKLEGEELRDADQLDVWTKFTECLETMVTVLKVNDTKPNLRVFMKGCTAVLKLFLSHGMPTCTFMFKHQPAVVSQILKKLQVTTRYIQTICNFVKVSKDTGLTQFLPPIRAVMETILLRVKNIIVLNNCADAFFVGSMKNRDLKGQEIPSQEVNSEDEDVDIPRDSESENEHNDENANDDDKESDNEDEEETNESASL